MRIQAKFNGKCAKCGRQLPGGTEIDYVDRKAYCVGCGPNDEKEITTDSSSLADRLHFVECDRAESIRWSELRFNGPMRELPDAHRDVAIEPVRGDDAALGLFDSVS